MPNALRSEFSNIYPPVLAKVSPMVPGATSIDNPVWDRAVDTDVQGAVDRVLQYLRTEKIDLTFSASGNLVDLALRLSNAMQAVITDPAMADDVRVVTAHMVSWMCDYAERAGVDRLLIQLNPADMAGGSMPSVVVADNGFQVPIVSSENASDVSKQVADVGRKLTLDLKMNAPGVRPGMMGPGGGGAAPQQIDRDGLMFGGKPIESDDMRPLAQRMDLDFLRSHASQLSTVRAEAQQLGQLIDRAQGAGVDAVSATLMSLAPVDLSIINGPVLSAFDVASLLPGAGLPSSQSPVWTGVQAAANDPVMAAPVISLRVDDRAAQALGQIPIDARPMSGVSGMDGVALADSVVPTAFAPLSSDPIYSSVIPAPSVVAPALSGEQSLSIAGAVAQPVAATSVYPIVTDRSVSVDGDQSVAPGRAMDMGSAPVARDGPSVVVTGPEPVGLSAFLTPTSAVNIAAAQTVAMNENISVALGVPANVPGDHGVRITAMDPPRIDAPAVGAPALSASVPVVDTVTVAPIISGDRSSVVSDMTLSRPDVKMPDYSGGGEIKGFDTSRVEMKNPDIKEPEFKSPEMRGPEVPVFDTKPNIKGPEIPVLDRKPNIKPEITPDIPGPKIPPQPPFDRGSDPIIRKPPTKCKKGFDECHCGEENQKFEQVVQELGGGHKTPPPKPSDDIIRKMREARQNAGVKETFTVACEGCGEGNCLKHGATKSATNSVDPSASGQPVQSDDGTKRKKTRSLAPE